MRALHPFAVRLPRILRLVEIARRWHRHPQQHDTTRARQCRSSGQFTEALVEGQQNSLLARRPCENVRIGRAWRGYPQQNDIVPGCR
jgi:hypothetical protein